MDHVLLAKIANNVFLQRGDYAITVYEYDIDWKTLSALARTCKALRAHLYGVRQLFHNLKHGHTTKSLPQRWGFDYPDLHKFDHSALPGVLRVFCAPLFPLALSAPAMEIDVKLKTPHTPHTKFKRLGPPQPRPRTALYRQTRRKKYAKY